MDGKVQIINNLSLMLTDPWFCQDIRKTIISALIISFTILCSCKNRIETSETLSKQDVDLIRKLNLLDREETIYKFYSEFENHLAGNFYTDKRIAHYWLDEHDVSKNKIEFAYYQDIIKLDTVYFAGATYCPYLKVNRRDSSIFKIYVDGTKPEIKAFFEDAITKWQEHKK